MIKLQCGTYDNVPILYCPYRIIKPKEQQLTYRLAVKKANNWYSILPWYVPLHRWTWYNLCKIFGKENIELDDKAIQTFHQQDDYSKKIENHVLKDDFEFYTEPYPFQLEDFFRLIYWPRIPLFIECGLGKSKIVLDSIRYNKDHALYVCPAPLVGNMINEVKIHSRNEIQVFPIDVKWFRKFSKKLEFKSADYKTTKANPIPNWKKRTNEIKDYFEEKTSSLNKNEPILFLTTYNMIVNYRDIIKDFLEYNMFVADESHKLKTHDAQRTLAALYLAGKTYRRVLMSGTASLGTPLDLFPQYKLLDPTILGGNYYKFFNKYCQPDPDYKGKAIGFKNLHKLNTAIKPITIVQTKEDCLPDLPARTETIYNAMLSAEEESSYLKMSRIDWDKKEGDYFDFRGKTLQVKHGAVKMLKLKQIASGFINMAQPNYELCENCEHMSACARDSILPNTPYCLVDKTPIPPDIEYFSKPGKIRLLKELLANILIGTQEKIIIYAHFTAELNLLEKTLKDDFKIKTFRIDGSTKDAGKVALSASSYNGPAVLLAQISCGIGWNFTIANKVVYYSLDLQYESYAQSRDRVRRIGQKFNITEYHLHSLYTLDEKVKSLTNDKEHIVSTLLSKDCSSCKWVSLCTKNKIKKWDTQCEYAKEYSKPTLNLRIYEPEIHKLAMKMV